MKQIIRKCDKLVHDHSYCEICNARVSFDNNQSYCKGCKSEIHIDHFINDDSINSDSVSDDEISNQNGLVPRGAGRTLWVSGGIDENLDIPFITIPNEIKSNQSIQSDKSETNFGKPYYGLSDEKLKQLGGRKVHNENSDFTDQIDIYYKTSNIIKCPKLNIKNKLFYLGSVSVERRPDVYNLCIKHTFEEQVGPDGRILFKCSIKNLIFICKCFEKAIRLLIGQYQLSDDDGIILDASCIFNIS